MATKEQSARINRAVNEATAWAVNKPKSPSERHGNAYNPNQNKGRNKPLPYSDGRS